MSSGEKKMQASRTAHAQVGAYVPMEAYWSLQEHLIRKGREQGRKPTLNSIVLEALRDYGEKHGLNLSLGNAE